MEAIGVVVLILLAPALMVAAHVYASMTQDRHVSVVVQLHKDEVTQEVVLAHQAKYKVDVSQSWDSLSTSGYRATAPTRFLVKLRADSSVARVDELDAG